MYRLLIAASLGLGSNARAAYEAFLRHGAIFPSQLGSLLALVPSQVEDVLGELAAAGLVTSDGYPALRTLLGVNARKRRRSGRRSRSCPSRQAGRWTLLRSGLTPAVAADERIELHDDAVLGVSLRVARGERQLRIECVVDDPDVGRKVVGIDGRTHLLQVES